MTAKKDRLGGYAFPGDATVMRGGMTMRDWFAGQALAGLASDDELTVEKMASIAYRAADAMIAERNQE